MLNFRQPTPRGPALILWIAAVCLAVSGCGGAAPEAPGESVEVPTPLVAVASTEIESWRETVELSVELAPWAAVTVAAEVSGRVVDLRVDHGDRVREGDVLARLDSATAQAELEQAQARRRAASASWEQARRDLERGRSLAGENGILSKDELDRLELAVSTGEASALEAEAAVQVLEERLADMDVRAPFSGTVSERHAELGSWLGVGDPVLRLVDSRRLKARGSASQADRVRLDLDAAVEIRTDALGDRGFDGRLRYLGAEADAATGTYLVEAEVAAAQGDGPRLLPGMRGSMVLEIESHRDVLLPRTALVDGAVFVVQDGVAVRRAVESEAIGPGRVRVLGGVEAGELVVVQGQHRLADGVEVNVREGGAS
ncbi:MAG: efflux RND transporter periplasmic adaptor subunit [Acidobacteriota bacterium]